MNTAKKDTFCVISVFLSYAKLLLSNARLKLAKNQAYAKQHPEAELWLLEIIHILHPSYHPKIIGHTLKISKRTSVSVFM